MKKMNQVKQVLNTCSPLEKIVKINEAIGTGVNTLSKKLYSETKNKNPDSSSTCKGVRKDEPPVSNIKQKNCDPCTQFNPNEEKQTASNVPGCMPFTEDVPVRPHYKKEATHPIERIHPSLKNKGCGCNLGSTIPPEDQQ